MIKQSRLRNEKTLLSLKRYVTVFSVFNRGLHRMLQPITLTLGQVLITITCPLILKILRQKSKRHVPFYKI